MRLSLNHCLHYYVVPSRTILTTKPLSQPPQHSSLKYYHYHRHYSGCGNGCRIKTVQDKKTGSNITNDNNHNDNQRYFSTSSRDTWPNKILIDKGILDISSPPPSSSSKQKQHNLIPFSTQRPNLVTWYACGPTVYDSAHIGHASSYIRLDIIRRILESQNITVLQVMGITDIDDKIIARSNELQIPWTELGRKYELEFLSDLKRLNIKFPYAMARVSDFIPNIIQFVSDLISSGLAYPVNDGSVYFDTSKYGAYGKFRNLSNIEEELLSDGENDTGKKDRKDFAVWKGYKPGEPFWETVWGRGRPGWHIECSVMASHFFGSKLDIHSGGMDLIFPHHENEEAQCCAKFGQDQWVSHWIHTGHLITKGDVKMSKSLGNTTTIGDFLKDNSANTLRMMCLLSPYSNTLEYSEETKRLAFTILRKIESFIGDCNSIILGQVPVQQKPGSHELLWNKITSAQNSLTEALINNFDTPRAISILLGIISDFHQNIETYTDSNKATSVDLSLVMACGLFAQKFLDVVGIGQVESQANTNNLLLDPVLTELLVLRKAVRSYSLAFDEKDKTARKLKIKERQHLTKACDDARTNLKTIGIEVKDSGDESSWQIRSES